MRKIHKIAAVILSGAVLLTGKAITAEAAEDPIAGITVSLEDFYQNAGDTDEKAVQSLMDEISQYDNLAFAQVNNYVNIRSKAGGEGEVLGKLFDNGAAYILGKEDGWYRIKSGSVTGYIKSEYLTTGDKAEGIAKETGKRTATVNTITLKVRKEASTDSEVLTLAGMGEDFPVLEESDGWIKIKLGNNLAGYVSSDYVIVKTVFEEAVSLKEEQERLRQEEASGKRTEDGRSDIGSSEAYSGSSVGCKIASYAVQFAGNPYVWGGTSLTNGTDCSGFTQSIYKHFGIYIPRSSRTQAAGGERVSLNELKPGDLVFYTEGGVINHVAIYIGNGRVISASSPQTGIRVTGYKYRTPYKAVRYY